MSNNDFRGGFSFRDDVINKPQTHELYELMLGTHWTWAEGATPEQLKNCLTQRGFAVTPARWHDGFKSKKNGRLLEANFILLDYDQGLSWEECKENEFFNTFAAFAYTSCSHGKPGKGDRFRVVFALNRTLKDAETFDRVLYGLRHFSPSGDDPAINAASLLYGNTNALVHEFNMDNRLDVESCYMQWALMDAERRLSREAAAAATQHVSYDEDNSIRRVKRWLGAIPNSSRSTWMKVAGCLKNIEGNGYQWAYPLFLEWSAEDYPDFDDYECQKLWDSLDYGMGGFNTLKRMSKYFDSFPFDKEVDQHKLNELNFNNDKQPQRNYNVIR